MLQQVPDFDIETVEWIVGIINMKLCEIEWEVKPGEVLLEWSGKLLDTQLGEMVWIKDPHITHMGAVFKKDLEDKEVRIIILMEDQDE